jgi:predicted dehydrogenase
VPASLTGATVAVRALPPLVRVGVVGCGYWGSKHARVLAGIGDVSAEVEIVAAALADALDDLGTPSRRAA